MFIEKPTSHYRVARVIRRLALMLLIAIASLLVTIFVFRTPLAPNAVIAAALASLPITPTVSTRCVDCITWPNSDIRLDTASGNGADLDPLKAEGLKGVPLLFAFGVADNGNIITDTQYRAKLRYNWAYSCEGSHDASLTVSQTQFITSYNPTFFDHTAIDSPTQYKSFVQFLRERNDNNMIGYYHSSTTCLEGPTNPYTENYYPPNAADCYRLAPHSPAVMDTRAWPVQYCSARTVRWIVNVAKPEIRSRFQDILLQNVKAVQPRPSFVFLDNGIYIHPEFAWAKGGKAEDCRMRASAHLTGCSGYNDLKEQYGYDIYFDDFMEHYRTLIARLEEAGIRSILNTGTPAAIIGYAKDIPGFAHQFEEAIGQNGIAFEDPFNLNLRTNFTDTKNEIALHQRLLNQGKLVVFYADYKNESASTWMAVMAMLTKNPGQSLFVARDPYSSTLNWISWPTLYGSPVTTATVQPVSSGNRNIVGDNWFMQRQFQKDGITREITAVHFGVNLQNVKAFSVTLLAPDLITETYKVLYSKPQLGVWDEATRVYTATHRSDPNGPVQADYFILGAQCSETPTLCKKLIAVSVGVFK